MSRRNPHPHVAWRDGRPRFSPDQVLRAMGYRGRDLRHDDGRWFTRGEAVDWSLAFQAELAARRMEAKKPKAKARPAASPRRASYYTVAQLVEDWRRSPRWQAPDGKGGRRLSANSKRDYAQKLAVLEADHPLIWNAPAALVAQPVLRQAYETTWMKRGIATARGMMLVLSSAFVWGILSGKVARKDNPARGLKMEQPEPRLRVGTRREISTLVAAADAIGRPEIGDMVLLGVWTGQRQADRLALQAGQKLGRRRRFHQAKTGAIVAVLEAPELEARLAQTAARRAAAKAAALLAAGPDERRAVEARFAHVILDEARDHRHDDGRRRWQPFTKYHYPHVFAAVRAAAVAGVPDGEGGWRVEPCPSLADFRDQDLRDTAVTWMALAEATIPEIIAVTGHTAESATQILKHYLARHPEMADSAIGKMITWYEGGGETEFGL